MKLRELKDVWWVLVAKRRSRKKQEYWRVERKEKGDEGERKGIMKK